MAIPIPLVSRIFVTSSLRTATARPPSSICRIPSSPRVSSQLRPWSLNLPEPRSGSTARSAMMAYIQHKSRASAFPIHPTSAPIASQRKAIGPSRRCVRFAISETASSDMRYPLTGAAAVRGRRQYSRGTDTIASPRRSTHNFSLPKKPASARKRSWNNRSMASPYSSRKRRGYSFSNTPNMISDMRAPENALDPGRAQHPGEPFRFPRRQFPPGASQPVIPSSYVFRPLIQFFDQLLFEQRLDRTVKRPRPQPQLAVGLSGHRAHDAVSVQVLAGQSQKNVKGRGGQRVELSSGHIIVQRYIV